MNSYGNHTVHTKKHLTIWESLSKQLMPTAWIDAQLVFRHVRDEIAETIRARLAEQIEQHITVVKA